VTRKLSGVFAFFVRRFTGMSRFEWEKEILKPKITTTCEKGVIDKIGLKSK
jgi:hypothetical protein